MIRWLGYPCRRALRSKFLWSAAILLLLLAAAACAWCRFAPAEEPSGEYKSVYGILEYESPEELAAQIASAEEALRLEQQDLEEAIAKNLYSDAQIASSEQNIRQMQTMLRAMRVLYEEKISYASAVQYGDFDRENGASVAVLLFLPVSAVLGGICAARIALKIPSERKDGQAKLTFLLPVGKVRYAAGLAFAEFAGFALLTVAFALFLLPSLYLFLGTGSAYVLVATSRTAFLLTVPAAVFLSLGFALFYLFCCAAVGFIASLLLKSPVASLLITLAVWLSGYLVFLGGTMVGSRPIFLQWLLSCAVRPEFAFFSQSGAVWISVLVALAYLIPLGILALVRFHAEDIR